MAYVYSAEIYCDDCGNLIQAGICGAGQAPSDLSDKYSYDSDECPKWADSDEYPKWADDDADADSPQHCGSGESCINAEVLPSGEKIGCLLGTNLTTEGENYVKEAVAEGGEVAEFWREQFDWIDWE